MTKERLKNYRAMLKEKSAIERQITAIETTLLRPKVQRMSHTPSGPSKGNAMEDLAVRHMELRDLYMAKLAQMDDELRTIERDIDMLPSTERLLLRLRYIHGLSWEKVCVEMAYSWKQVHRIHAKALESLRTQE